MSNLYYAICVLESERDNVHGQPKERAEQLNEAIALLREELQRRKNERDEKKKEEIKNVNVIISIREPDCRFLASFNNGPSRVFRTPYEILEAIGEEIDQLVIQSLLKIDPGKPFMKDNIKKKFRDKRIGKKNFYDL